MLKTNRFIKSDSFKKAEKIVIVLHGYGTSGDDFAKVGKVFLSKKLDNTVFLFPDAPENCAAGFGKQWFKLDKMDYEELRSGLDKAAPLLHNYIESNSKEYNCDNINLIGFSQGAIMALEMIYYPGIKKIIAYSGLFAISKNKNIASNPDILIIHSDDDEVVPYNNAKVAQENLTALGTNSKLKTCHNIGHSISLEGWTWGIEFLKN